MITLLLTLLLAGSLPAASGVKRFRQADLSIVPRELIASNEICSESDEECWESFRDTAEVWTGDVNGDGVEEILLHPGSYWAGSAGQWFFLFQERDGDWIPLSEEGWLVRRFWFQILPVHREGYHDLRVAGDWCVKWNGAAYVSYEPEDYHQLSPEFFDATNWWDAEMFWTIRFAGRDRVDFEPRWFPLPADWPPFTVNDRLPDPEGEVTWVALFKAGVWGQKGSQAFLLLPRPAYLGAGSLRIEGDWLLIYEAGEPLSLLLARYNRRTGELILENAE